MTDTSVVDGLEQPGALPDGVSGCQRYATSDGIVDGLRPESGQEGVHCQVRCSLFRGLFVVVGLAWSLWCGGLPVS